MVIFRQCPNRLKSKTRFLAVLESYNITVMYNDSLLQSYFMTCSSNKILDIHAGLVTVLEHVAILDYDYFRLRNVAKIKQT